MVKRRKSLEPVTPAGEKEFQIRLIDPKGETVAREDMGSGVLTNKLDNTQVRYTTKGTIDYNNQDTEGCIGWKVNDQLPKGMYDIEIYNNGFKVGTGTEPQNNRPNGLCLHLSRSQL